MQEKIVIVGGSIAGAYTMIELVKNNFAGEITLIDAESNLPYNPYPLTKDWMRDMANTEPPLLKDEDYYPGNKIDLRLNTRANQVDWRNQTVTTDQGETLAYDKLVIATGSKLRKLNIAADDTRGIFYLRSFQDALAIKSYLNESKQILIIGTGFIGLEFAASFRQLGKEVSVLVRSGKPLEKILGPEAANYFVAMHESQGINFIYGEETESFLQDDMGKVRGIMTKTGQEISADMVIVAVGVQPNLSLEIEGIETERETIVVNEYGETNLPNIYAAGDITSWPYQGKLIHIEHWETAWSQARSLAKNIIETKSSAYQFHPYFWTDQYDQTFEYLGYAPKWADTELIGSLTDGKFAIAYLDERGHLLAVLFANKFLERKLVRELLDKKEVFKIEDFI